jgi:hypothetical protein
METIIVSAFVAGFTTLAIEYFAKPSLEKRKTRILNEYKLRTELSEWLGKVNFHVGAWESHGDESDLPERRDRIYFLIQTSMKEYPYENLSKQLGLNKHVEEVVSNLLAALEAWKMLLEYGATGAELDSLLLHKIMPLFELAEEAVDSSQIQMLPKIKLRNRFRVLSA